MTTLTAIAPTTADSLAADALIERLMRGEGKAEIVNGQIQTFPMAGFEPGFAADEICASLRLHARAVGFGIAFADGKCFLCELPSRRPFSPDAAS